MNRISPQIDAFHIHSLAATLEQLELDPTPVLDAAGLLPPHSRGVATLLSAQDYLAGVQAALEQPAPIDLGLLVGQRGNVLEQGMLGFAVLSGRHLGQSLERYLRYQGVATPLLRVSLHPEVRRIILGVMPAARGQRLSVRQYTFLVQQWLGGWQQWAELAGEAGGFFSFVRMAYLFDRDGLAACRHHLGCEVEYGCGRTAGVFPREWLSRAPLTKRGPSRALCNRVFGKLVASLRIPDGTRARVVRELVMRPGSVTRMEQMAPQLNMSARTLRRRLAAEDTTYQQLVIDYRLALAELYLTETQLPANEIADLVGYSDTTNFYRTFRAARGLTPNRFRSAASMAGPTDKRSPRDPFYEGDLPCPVTRVSSDSVGPQLQPPSTLSDCPVM